jgi:hypothetical protein
VRRLQMVTVVAVVGVAVPLAGAIGASSALAAVPARAAAVSGTSIVDFNGDGHADLAVGAPSRSVGGVSQVGDVEVTYGAGAHSGTTQIISPATSGVPGTITYGENFGQVLATGDVNGDGYTDLIIGVPGYRPPHADSTGTARDGGAVFVIPGSASGLDVAKTQLLYEGVDGIPGAPRAGENFGGSLAVGNLNNEDVDDLVIGVPNESINVSIDGRKDRRNDGEILEIPGTRSGLDTHATLRLTAGTTGILGPLATTTGFGGALSIGDFDGDGIEDLGFTSSEQQTHRQHGYLFDVPGSASGLKPTKSVRISMGAAGAGALVSADFNGDGRSDLATTVRHGVSVVNGGAHGLVASTLTTYITSTTGPSPSALAVGDVDGNGRPDVAVGDPAASIDGKDYSGSVTE